MPGLARWVLCALVLLGVRPIVAAEADDAVHVAGVVAKPGDWTAAKMKQDFAGEMKLVQYSSHGQQHHSHCVPLLSVLQGAGLTTDLKMDPAADPKTKNFPLRLTIVIQGRDEYTTALSLGEILPAVGNKEAWLALDNDDSPLSEREAPVKLIVSGDAKPARWVRGVASITVVGGAATTQPAGSSK